MSQFLPSNVPKVAGPDLATQIIGRDPSLPLQSDERQLLSRLLGEPAALPQVFWAALIDKMITELPSQIPIQQLQGFSRFTATTSVVATNEATTSTTFADLATVGPTISGLSKGDYVLLGSAQISKAAVVDAGVVGYSINGAAAVGWFNAEIGPGSQYNLSQTSPELVSLTESSNEIKLKYRTNNGNSVSFQARRIITLRVGGG